MNNVAIIFNKVFVRYKDVWYRYDDLLFDGRDAYGVWTVTDDASGNGNVIDYSAGFYRIDEAIENFKEFKQKMAEELKIRP